MTLLRTYQLSVFTSCIMFVAYWFSPWLYGYLDTETQSILAWGGYKAALNLPEWFWNAYLLITIVSYIGMFLLRKIFRTLFLVVMIFSFPITFIGGIYVMTGIEVILIDLSTLLTGFIIALAYYSNLKKHFY